MEVRGRYVFVEGVRAFVEEAGEGRPVVCLHTAGQSGFQWRYVIEDLAARRYRVVVPDLPGHGRSAFKDGRPVQDLHEYAEWVWSLIGVLGLPRPVIVGCSIGGKIALDLAVHHGADCAAVIACEADGRPRPRNVNALLRSLEDAASPSRQDRTYFGTLAACGDVTPPERLEEIAMVHRREDSVITTYDQLGWARHDLMAQLGGIRCPTQLAVGDQDFFVPVSWVEETARAIPGAAIEVLEGVGHYPMEEMPDFAERVDGWVRKLLGR
ncbi:MAG: alpha/beta hydrolase [Actinomycetia bacterium]|nr:alpha/beta hydrolase [Actinomycetes bacterium]